MRGVASKSEGSFGHGTPAKVKRALESALLSQLSCSQRSLGTRPVVGEAKASWLSAWGDA